MWADTVERLGGLVIGPTWLPQLSDAQKMVALTLLA